MTNSADATQDVVLLVEDNQSLRESFKDALELGGYQVITATNGKDALEMLTGGLNPNMVLLDMMMPVMTGKEFLASVRKLKQFRNLPILIMSAMTTPQHSNGALGYLRKPVNLDDVMNVVAQYATKTQKVS